MNILFNFIRKYKYLFLIILISLAVYYRWLSFSIFAYSDYGFSFFNTLREIPDFGTWDSFGLGSVNLLPWRLMGNDNLLFGLFGFFGFDSNIADKFIIMWPWVILSGVCSYFLVKKITKSNIGGLIGSFVFSYNTYFLAINRAGHLLLSTASIFAVLSLLFFIKSLEEKRLYLVILTAFFLFFTGANDFRILYIIVWVLFFYFLYFLILRKNPLDYKSLLKDSLVAALPIIIFFLLNTFWVAPSFNTGSLVENPAFSRPLFGSGFFDITKAITLFHPFWTGGKIDWFIVQKIPFYFWLIPIFASFGLILNKKNKNVVFFGIIALIGIFLSKQVAEPFGGVYKWLFENFPGFNAFREASKFYFLTALGYSVLIGVFTAWLWENWNKKRWQIYGKYLLVFLISFIFLWNAKPIITGEIGKMFVPRHILNDYLIFKGYILKQPEYFRTFWTPAAPEWGFYTNQKPKISNVAVIGSEWKNYVSLNPGYNNLPINKQLTEIFKIKGANELFDNSSIKYVVVPTNDFANDADPFYYCGREKNSNIRDWYISELNKVEWLKKIDIGTKELVVYENENYKPHVYLTITPSIISGNIEALMPLAETKYLDGKSVLIFTEQMREAEKGIRGLGDWGQGTGGLGNWRQNANFVFKDSSWRDLAVELSAQSTVHSPQSTVRIETPGIYEIYFERGKGERETGNGKWKVRVDGNEVLVTNYQLPITNSRKYVKVGEVELEEGKHEIKLKIKNKKLKMEKQKIKMILVNKEERERTEKVIWKRINSPETEVCYIFEK